MGLLPWEGGKHEHVTSMYKIMKDLQRMNKEHKEHFFHYSSHREAGKQQIYIYIISQFKTGSKKKSAIYLYCYSNDFSLSLMTSPDLCLKPKRFIRESISLYELKKYINLFLTIVVVENRPKSTFDITQCNTAQRGLA